MRRFRHPSGIEELELTRSLRIPARLEQDREHHSSDTRLLRLVVVARVVPGIERVDLRVRLENAAEDHRLRLLFPTHHPTTKVVAASTFSVMTRSLAKPDASKWVHPAPDSFPHQGWVSLNELTLVAPGLPEAEVREDGTLTLVRAVGWLSRVVLEIEPRAILLSALKPAEHDDGAVLPLLNPSDHMLEARIRLGLPVRSATPVRLDETPIGEPRAVESGEIRLEVPARALRSLHLRPC